MLEIVEERGAFTGDLHRSSVSSSPICNLHLTLQGIVRGGLSTYHYQSWPNPAHRDPPASVVVEESQRQYSSPIGP